MTILQHRFFDDNVMEINKNRQTKDKEHFQMFHVLKKDSQLK